MNRIISGKASKIVDEYCISKLGIPALVLMERAAYGVYCHINKDFPKKEAVIVCGRGNNGADGLAAARMLYQNGSRVRILIIGDVSKCSSEFNTQLNIVKNLGISIEILSNVADRENIHFSRECVIVDALFGIGLSRKIEGLAFEAIDKMNKSGAAIISVDIPSGLNADNGVVQGIAVRADMTVTFGTYKTGHFLCDGKEYCGRLVIWDAGFDESAYLFAEQTSKTEIYRYLDETDLSMIPARMKNSNKGTYGSVNVVAGSEKMFGAVYFSAAAAYRCGVGIVNVYTHLANIPLIKEKLPEAIVNNYIELKQFRQEDVVVIGPGISVTDESERLLTIVLKSKCKTVIDADALNVMSKNKKLLLLLHSNVIITPHIKEMSRLTGRECIEIKENIVDIARKFAKKYRCVTVIKDAATNVADEAGRVTVNVTGNSGMSTGGSGDVLAGIIGGLLSQKTGIYESACAGVYLHGLAGDLASEKKSEYGMIASDIVESIPEILKMRQEI